MLKDSINKKVLCLQYALFNSILDFNKAILFGNKKKIEANKILIFRTGSLGDSVCALPAINSIRRNYPDAKIDILTNAVQKILFL